MPLVFGFNPSDEISDLIGKLGEPDEVQIEMQFEHVADNLPRLNQFELLRSVRFANNALKQGNRTEAIEQLELALAKWKQESGKYFRAVIRGSSATPWI
jgi:hypothetical protein